MMPNLNKDLLVVGETLRLPHMALHTLAKHDTYVKGIILVDTGDTSRSDYYFHREGLAADRINCSEYLQGGTWFAVIEQRVLGISRGRAFAAWDMFKNCKISEPNVNDLVTRDALCKHLNWRAHYICITQSGKIDYRILVDEFKLTSDEVIKLITATEIASKEFPHRPLNVYKALKPAREKVLAALDALAPQAIEWWIITDPGRQYTGSLNPQFEHPSEWYGSAYVCETTQAPREPPTKAIVPVKVFDTSNCAICLSKFESDCANIVTLLCGHKFHYAPYDSCQGFHKWALLNQSCPICRAPIITPPEPTALEIASRNILQIRRSLRTALNTNAALDIEVEW